MRIFKIIILTKLKKKRRTEIFSGELETIKKYKMELLEVKRNTLAKINNLGDCFNRD